AEKPHKDTYFLTTPEPLTLFQNDLSSLPMPSLKIINGKVITPYRVLSNASLLISGGVIRAISENGGDAANAGDDVTIIDAAGCYVSPGFIDLHVHGGGGHDFMDGTEEAFLAIARLHA